MDTAGAILELNYTEMLQRIVASGGHSIRLEAIAARLEAIAIIALLGWRPLLLGWRPSLLGWRP